MQSLRNVGSEEEVTRELLIAISYTLPDKLVRPSSENSSGEKPVEDTFNDGAEKYRSELISISDSDSLDDEGLAVTKAGKEKYRSELMSISDSYSPDD